MKNLKQIAVYASVAALGAVATLAVKASAALPTENVLTYPGFLENPDGTPVTNPFNVSLALWNDPKQGAGKKLCETTVPEQITPVSGRFQVPLPEDCVGAVKSNGNVWLELQVDGASLGRTPLGAVPYAVTAGSVDSLSDALAKQLVPSGAVMPFDLATCPTGWTPLMPAVGKVIVGAGAALKLGATVGADSVALLEAQMPAHKHTISDPGHAHPPNGATFVIGGGSPAPAMIRADSGSYGVTGTTGSATTGITVDSAGGGKPFDNRQASLALLYCKKD
jgi:hypothetical protein